MTLTITITRYTAPIDDSCFDYINADYDITVETITPTPDDDAVSLAICLLNSESWEPSCEPIEWFGHTDLLRANYPEDDQETEECVTARFSEDWSVADIQAIVRAVIV